MYLVSINVIHILRILIIEVTFLQLSLVGKDKQFLKEIIEVYRFYVCECNF